ncbi:hypothetical protein E2320_003703, partial [Naja naja]
METIPWMTGASILEKVQQTNIWNISTAHLNVPETQKLICSCRSRSRTTKSSFSPQSNSREFLVVDIPPPPVLKLDPLSQRVKEGDCLFLLCLAEGSITKKKFHFYKDGAEITSSEEGLLEPSYEPTDPLQNGSLRIPHASFNHNGEFACICIQDSDPIWRYSGGHYYYDPAGSIFLLLLDKEKQNPAGRKKGEPGLALREICRQYMRKMEINHFMFLFISIAALEESPSKEQSGPTRKTVLPKRKQGGHCTITLSLNSRSKRPSCFSSLSSQKCKLWLLRPLKEGEDPIKPEARREIEKEEGPSLISSCFYQITLKFLLFTSLVSLRWTPLKTSSPNIKWRIGFESGSPNGSHRIWFFFICKDQSASVIEDEHLSNNTFNVKTENLSSGQIKIICICKIMERLETSGRWPYSPESNQLVFSVVGVPPSPLLKVDPLSQRVKEGDPLVFLCSTEGGTTEKKFHFYKDGVEITSSEEGLLEPSTEPTNPLQNASLRIPHASFNHSGEFACSYEEKRSNRWIMSSWSQGVNITVEPASVSQEQFQLREKKEERNHLPMMEPQAATADTSSPVKDSEVNYSCIQNFFTPSPAVPTRKKRLTQREEEGILYSDI